MSTKIRIFDFETTGVEYFNKTGKAEVRLAGLSTKLAYDQPLEEIRHRKRFRHYFTIRSFIEDCCKLENGTMLYAVNLSKFDGEFIVKFFKENHDLLDTLKESDFKKGASPNPLVKGTNALKDFEVGDKAFHVTMDDRNKLYEIRLRSIYNKVIIWRCTLNLYSPFLSVKAMMKALKWDEELESIKTQEDYTIYDCSHEEFMDKCKDEAFLKERLLYLKYDLMTPIAYMVNDAKHNRFSPLTYHKKIPLTAAGHAFALFKKRFNNDSWYNYNQHYKNYVICDIIGCLSRYCKHKKVTRMPILSTELYDACMDTGYRGGFCFCNDKYVNQIIPHVNSLDIKSSFPNQYCNFPMPYGTPKHTEGKKLFMDPNKLYFYQIRITHLLFKADPNVLPPYFPNINPRLPVAGRYIIDYTPNIVAPAIRIGVWSDELDWFLKHYEMRFTYLYTLEFDADMKIGETMREIVDLKWDPTLTKAETDGIKVIINGFYGKFAEKYEKTSNAMVIDKNGNIQEWNKITQFSKKYPYVASRITWLGRKQLYEQEAIILKLGGTILYGDTDSIKFFGIQMSEEIKKTLNIGTQLGQWELEWEDVEFKYLAPKAYIWNTYDEHGWRSKLKGYNKQINPNDFNYGHVFTDKLRRQRVDTGVYLKETYYELKQNANNIRYPQDWKEGKKKIEKFSKIF